MVVVRRGGGRGGGGGSGHRCNCCVQFTASGGASAGICCCGFGVGEHGDGDCRVDVAVRGSRAARGDRDCGGAAGHEDAPCGDDRRYGSEGGGGSAAASGCGGAWWAFGDDDACWAGPWVVVCACRFVRWCAGAAATGAAGEVGARCTGEGGRLHALGGGVRCDHGGAESNSDSGDQMIMRMLLMRVVVPVVGFVLAVVLGLVLWMSSGSGSTADAATPGGVAGMVCATNPSATSVAGFSGEQLTNAAIIVAVGKKLHVPLRGQVIGVATAMQESTLKNVNYGDIMATGSMSSSRGLFQQLQTYGPTRTDPSAAAEMFYTGGPGGIPGLMQVAGWQSMPLAMAAEAVQHSSQPDLYAKWEGPADQVVGLVAGVTCSAPSASTGGAAGAVGAVTATAQKVIARAVAEVGVPYSWAGGDANGPTLGICGGGGAQNDCHIVGFDCSGLTEYAYAGVGIALPHQTQELWAAFPHITDRAQYRPGDLLLISSDGTASGIHHVVIFMGGARVVEAPYSGVLVRITDNFWATTNGHNVLGAVRPGG